jgi:hypothetical protein
MAQTITQAEVLSFLHNQMGHRVDPGGTDDDLKRYVQAAFDYCWRYYKWRWTTKDVTTAVDGFLPDDFDPLGYYSVADTYDVTYDYTANKYVLVPAAAVELTYQIIPPTLGDTGTPFPSASVVATGALIFAKQGENPTRADVQQEWDEFHSFLDRLVGQAESNVVRRPRNYHDLTGSFTGAV